MWMVLLLWVGHLDQDRDDSEGVETGLASEVLVPLHSPQCDVALNPCFS